MSAPGPIVYLSGGVGGSRLLDGLSRCLPPEDLVAVVNVADDFEHWGLKISPDLDTVLYALAGLGDPVRGWGIAGDTNGAFEMMRRFGASDWFTLGDRDLATHVFRTDALRRGETLTAVTTQLACALGVKMTVLPASDEHWRTEVETDEHGRLDFQTWLVRHRGSPPVRRVEFNGAARASDGVLDVLGSARAIIVGPSNPFVSIDPILALPQVRDRIGDTPVVGLSPIVGARAVKGPLAEMIESLLGRPPSARAISDYYGARHGIEFHGFVVESGDRNEFFTTARVHETRTIMSSREDRAELGRFVIGLLPSGGRT